MRKYAIICTTDWRILGYVEAENPLDALKRGMVKFNNPKVVAVYRNFSNDE